MSKVISIFIFILFVFILSSCQQSDVNPFELDIDFYMQEKTLINMTDNQKRALYQEMVFYESAIKYESQYIHIQSQETLSDPLDLVFNQTITTNYKDTFDFRTFEALDLNAIGYEQLIDTGGLSGRLRLFLQLLDDFTDTYFTSEISLSNPPFRIIAEENQVMATNEAAFELPVLLDFSIDITPETLINFIDPQITLLDVYEMTYGHMLSVPIIIDNVIQGVNIEATIEVVIVDGYVVYATIQSDIDTLTIPVGGLIDNTETLDVSLEIMILLDFLYERDAVLLPSANELNTFERVDAFTLPDVTSIFGN